MTRPDRQERAIEPAGRPHEAADLPEGVRTVADLLAELAGVLPGLRQALDRQADRGPEPLVFRKADAARMCAMAPRTLEYLASAGKFPRPDAYAGRCPLWTKATLQAWIDQGGGRI